MKLARPIFLGVVFAIAFFMYTSYRFATPPASWVTRNKLQITEAAGPQSLDPEELNNINIYKRTLPSVVNITSTSVAYDFFWGPVPEEGAGSGFIIDREGHILTNYHVVANAQKLRVTLSNKKQYPAQLVGVDKTRDLAVIQIKAPNLVPAVLGASKGLQVGQKVYAIGDPFGMFSGTMTRGIISSIRTVQEPNGTYIDQAIQTDAAINPGNSGGPLLNSHGDVIGINTMIAGTAGQNAGIGFAIPIDGAKAVINDIVQYGRVRRPSLGIVPLAVGPDLANQLGLPVGNGVLIMKVIPGGSADRAGLHGGDQRAYLGNSEILLGGDLIVAIDGQPVEDMPDIVHVMDNHHSGDVVTVTIYRGRRKMDLKVILEEPGSGTERAV